MARAMVPLDTVKEQYSDARLAEMGDKSTLFTYST